MWYFIIQQGSINIDQYRDLQQRADVTEVELFNEPYSNWYIFTIERANYRLFMDFLDLAGISYEAVTKKPSRDDLLASMR